MNDFDQKGTFKRIQSRQQGQVELVFDPPVEYAEHCERFELPRRMAWLVRSIP
jgi:hypothetical protein